MRAFPIQEIVSAAVPTAKDEAAKDGVPEPNQTRETKVKFQDLNINLNKKTVKQTTLSKTSALIQEPKSGFERVPKKQYSRLNMQQSQELQAIGHSH